MGTTDDAVERFVMDVLRGFERPGKAKPLFASTVRIMRELKALAVPFAAVELDDPEGDEDRAGAPFLNTLAALERLEAKGLVQRHQIDEETAQWRAISLLDAIALAADEKDDDE